MHIVIEGPDNVGKSTQCRKLFEKYDCVITKEPGGTTVGKKLRKHVLEGDFKSKQGEFLALLADRAEHVQKVIKSQSDRLIISDRGILSGIAYAMANGEDDLERIVDMCRYASHDTVPDLIVVLTGVKAELVDNLFFKDISDSLWNASRVIEGKDPTDVIEARGLSHQMNVLRYMVSPTVRDLLNTKMVYVHATSITQTHEIICSKIDELLESQHQEEKST